jgi:hypothetical protein
MTKPDAKWDISRGTRMDVEAVKQPDGSILKRKVDPLYRFISDPATGRGWEWREDDFPGLFKFLDAFVREWHSRVVLGTSLRKGQSSGGANAAAEKKRKAKSWQQKIEKKALRMLKAGKTCSNIGALLALDAGRAPGTVAKYAARLQKKSAE